MKWKKPELVQIYSSLSAGICQFGSGAVSRCSKGINPQVQDDCKQGANPGVFLCNPGAGGNSPVYKSF